MTILRKIIILFLFCKQRRKEKNVTFRRQENSQQVIEADSQILMISKVKNT